MRPIKLPTVMCERNTCLYLCPCLCLFLRLCSGFDCICGSVCIGDLFHIKWPRGDDRKHKPRRDTLEVALFNKVVASGGGVTDCLGRREKFTWVVQRRGRYDLLELLHSTTAVHFVCFSHYRRVCKSTIFQQRSIALLRDAVAFRVRGITVRCVCISEAYSQDIYNTHTHTHTHI